MAYLLARLDQKLRRGVTMATNYASHFEIGPLHNARSACTKALANLSRVNRSRRLRIGILKFALLFLAGAFRLMHIRMAAVVVTSTQKFVRFFEISAWMLSDVPFVGCVFWVFLDKDPIITQITSRYGRTT